MIPTKKLATAGLMLSALVMGACSPEAGEPGSAVAPAAVAASDAVYPFRIGAFEAFALKDGGITVPNDNQVFGVGLTPGVVADLLVSEGLGADALDLSIQPLLVRIGDRLVLFDAGLGSAFGGVGGRLPDSLRAAGVEPSQVTDVLISHGHADHLVGLAGDDGALVFPNATVRLTAPEWAAVQADDSLAATARAIAPRVETFAPGAEVLTGVTSVPVDGHTPGHTAYRIVSGDEELLYIGDSAHHSVISVQRPEWSIAFDGDDPVAKASREALLVRAADEGVRIYAVHFPFPGLGRVERRGEGFVWVPET